MDKKISISAFNLQESSGRCQYGRPKHTTENLAIIILSSSQNYCCSAILFAKRLTSSENWPTMPKIPDHVPSQSTLPQDKALALLLQISRQNLLSPCSYSHSLLHLTHLEGREGHQAFDGRSLKLTSCCRCLCLKASALSSCSLPRFCKLCSICASSRQQEHSALSSSSSLVSWSTAPPGARVVRLLYNTIHPLVDDTGPVYLHKFG